MRIKLKWKLPVLRLINRKELDQEKLFFLLTIAIGICTGLIATFINLATKYLTHLIKTDQQFEIPTFLWGGLLVFISGYITTRLDPQTSGSGIPFIKVWLVARNGYIRLSHWVYKLIATLLSLSSGMSVGREGPTVSVCAGFASSVGTYFALSRQKLKSLTAIGAAGGLAAAFNTPMAAVVFTLEEIVGDLNTKMLGSIIISSFVASVTTSLILGDHATFPQISYQLITHSQYFVYLIIGVCAAFFGPMWAKSVLSLRKFNMKIFKGHKLSIIMVSFFVIGLLSFVNPKILGSGHHFLSEVLLGKFIDVKVFVVLLILKFFATTISYGSGICGGLFMPTLFIGGMLGASIGGVAQYFFPQLVPQIGPFVLVGMGAYFAAVIRAPFTSILMIFEMTHDYNIIPPLMIANITSFFLAKNFTNKSIYELLSEQDGIQLPTREDDEIMDSLHVEHAMITDVVTLDAQLSLKQALSKVKSLSFNGFPVVKHNKLHGVISANEIAIHYSQDNEEKKYIGDIAIKKVITIFPDQSLLVAFHKLQKYKVSKLPVVSRLDHKELVGIITAEDIVANFGFHIQENAENGGITPNWKV